MQELILKLNFDWQPVLLDDGNEYLFPEKLTPRVKKQFRCPAVYRWNVFEKVPGDLKLIYIGETVRLCPDRISGYLKPGPTQKTNKRVSKEFNEYLQKGWKIRLETLAITDCSVNKRVFSEADLADSSFRRAIEQLIVTMAKQNGFKLLNVQ